MPINEEEKMHGAAILRLLEELGNVLPVINFSLRTGESRNCYHLLGQRPANLGKGKQITIGLFIKISTSRRSPWGYSFRKDHQDEILNLKEKFGECFTVFVTGNDGFAALSFTELKEILDEEHEAQEWVSVSRKTKQGYRVTGNNGLREKVLAQNAFPKSIVNFFKDAFVQ